jgi:hypothetical protein
VQTSGQHVNRPSTRPIRWAVYLLFLLAVTEVAAHISIGWILHPRAPFLFYEEPFIEHRDYQRYLLTRDPVLGWPRLDQIGTAEYDSSGARPSASRKEPPCVSLYGDSYTYGYEVTAEEAWGNVLAQLLGCSVANFGVVGYGTDQAYLRFKRNDSDHAPLVILGIYHENIVRVVNQYRFLINSGNPLTFKPRMLLEEPDVLNELPLPVDGRTDIRDVVRFPERHLAAEWFLPETPEGPVRLTFPFSMTILRALSTKRVRNWMRNRPSWVDFYDPNHPSNALATMVAIVQAFSDVATQRHKELLVLIFPAPSAIRFRREQGQSAAQSLTDLLAASRIEVLDLGEVIPNLVEADSYCDILTIRDRCQGHYNPRGNRLVAETVNEYLRRWSPTTATSR